MKKGALGLAIEKGVIEGRRVCVPELNAIMGRSAGAWRNQFKEQHGMLLKKYQALFKIRYVCHLARHRDMTQTDMIMEVGCDIARFSRTFKDVMGVTPYQFKQLTDKKANELIESHLDYEWQHDFSVDPPAPKE